MLAGIFTDPETGRSYLIMGQETMFPGQKVESYVYQSPGYLEEEVISFEERREVVLVEGEGWRRKTDMEGGGGSKERL